MARTITILAYTASFLAGVFLTSLMSLYQLTSRDIVGSEWSATLDRFNSVRGTGTAQSDAADENETLRKEVHDLQKIIEHLQKSNSEQSSAATNNQSVDKTSSASAQLAKSNENQTGMCSLLPQPAPTALSMWSSHLSQILDATKHPEDQDYTYREFTKLLLHYITPDRMQRGVKTLPLDWTPIERGLDVMYKRWEFIQNKIDAYKANKNLPADATVPSDVLDGIHKDPKIPRPLNVLAMGGSVTMGVVCNINPVTKTGIARRNCAWPGRLTSFFSMLFGGYQLIQFHTVAMGGTNTESGITVWDYSLLPGDTPYPDVVINAYATNDMHYNSVQSALAKNVTLERSVIELNQDYIRQLLTPKRECGHPPPLLLYLDDYLGNEQTEVMTTFISSQAIHLLSGYYGIGSISYADAVRDIVYGDNKEWWYHANWFEKGTYERAVHPHMGMHITASWIVAFYLMNLATTYCSLPLNVHAGHELDTVATQLKGGPKHRPGGLPPKLSGDLSLENISQLWLDDAKATESLWKSVEQCAKEGHAPNGDDLVEKPCMYSWVVGLERFLDKTKNLEGKLKPQITMNEGWSAADDNNKLGWVPAGNGSKFTMEWKSVIQPVRALTLMIMRSYGEKWDGSKLKVQIWSKDKIVASDEIIGYHDKKTSETYNIKMKIGEEPSAEVKEVTIGSDLKITFELIGGNTFKISGMAICDH